jgi:hypothetical protein
MDYCFPRDAVVAQGLAQDMAQTSAQQRGDYAVVLVGRDRETKMTLAHVVPHKGAEQDWVCEQVVRDLRKFGIHGKVTLKTDQEPAIRDLAVEICKLRGEARTLEELGPVGDSRGNGVAERGVQAVEEMMRVHKLALERRLGSKVPVSHKIVAWLVEHCADVLNRFRWAKMGKLLTYD